jgi:hypothetical protein
MNAWDLVTYAFIVELRMNNGCALQATLSDDEETHEEGNFLAFVTNSPLVENVASSFNISTQNACSNHLCTVRMFLKVM